MIHDYKVLTLIMTDVGNYRITLLYA